MRAADRFSSRGIGDARMYDQLASIERAQRVRREVLNFCLGMLAGVVMLLVMAAPWDRIGQGL